MTIMDALIGGPSRSGPGREVSLDPWRQLQHHRIRRPASRRLRRCSTRPSHIPFRCGLGLVILLLALVLLVGAVVLLVGAIVLLAGLAAVFQLHAESFGLLGEVF